ncbi:MAG: AAA family ATPase [Moraxella sp.]|uniref:AAA family ATPase n=1 Tax=Moraxella sp. TaxID=479 RepID=UPI0026DD206D|nr:AAA family ATPase [Moraxella sp.]MDO4449606.1 AAA family ATPase [Moraxella sp.]
MKILTSQYHRPRKIFNERYIDKQYQIISQDLEHITSTYDNPYYELLSSTLPSVDFSDMVMKKDRLVDFVKCTDYHPVAFDKKNNHFYEREVCYFYEKFELFIVASEDLSNEYDKTIFESGLLRVEHIFYDPRNENSLNNIRTFFNEYLQKYNSQESKILLLLKEGKDLVFKHQGIKPYVLDLKTMYNDDFLPVHHKIQEELSCSKKGMVLLHGLAGTGKTNYIKWLTAQIPDKDFIFVPNNMIGELAKPEFMSMLIEQKNSVLVLEDCENYIAERVGGGNQTDVVGIILNIADGILSDVLECQFICTFNADLMDIDHALLRRGRLIAEYKFDKLSIEKCQTYMKSIGKNNTIDKEMTLAELTNIDEKEFKTLDDKKVGFGFV